MLIHFLFSSIGNFTSNPGKFFCSRVKFKLTFQKVVIPAIINHKECQREGCYRRWRQRSKTYINGVEERDSYVILNLDENLCPEDTGSKWDVFRLGFRGGEEKVWWHNLTNIVCSIQPLYQPRLKTNEKYLLVFMCTQLPPLFFNIFDFVKCCRSLFAQPTFCGFTSFQSILKVWRGGNEEKAEEKITLVWGLNWGEAWEVKLQKRVFLKWIQMGWKKLKLCSVNRGNLIAFLLIWEIYEVSGWWV